MKILHKKMEIPTPSTPEGHEAAKSAVLAVMVEQAHDQAEIARVERGGTTTYSAQMVAMPVQEYYEMVVQTLGSTEEAKKIVNENFRRNGVIY